MLAMCLMILVYMSGILMKTGFGKLLSNQEFVKCLIFCGFCVAIKKTVASMNAVQLRVMHLVLLATNEIKLFGMDKSDSEFLIFLRVSPQVQR